MSLAPPRSPLQTHAARTQRPQGFGLAAVVLMAGSVRQTDLGRGTQRAILDLPLRNRWTIGECWSEHVEELRRDWELPDLPMVVAANSIAGVPKLAASFPNTTVRVDSGEARGSGGALRDVTRGFDPNAYVLAAPGHALTREPIAPLLERLAATGADAVIHASEASTPSGFFLLRCGALDGVSVNGFADLKEQVLPQLAKTRDVRVVRTATPLPVAVRSLEGYMRALRAASDTGQLGADAGPLEDWRSAFAIVEDDAEVHSTARLHDSVVLAGGHVGPGALVVRSVVGAGGVVKAKETVFDRVVGGEKP